MSPDMPTSRATDTVEAVDGLGDRAQTPARRNVVVPLRQLETTKHPQ